MMEFIKKQSIAFYVSIAVVIMAIVSVIIYSVNAANVYFFEVTGSGAVLALTIVAIVLDVAIIVLAQLFATNKLAKICLDMAMIAVTILLTISLMLFLKDRVYYMAIVFGSELESDNPAAWAAMGQAVAGIVLYACTVILSVGAAFFNMRKPEKI